MRSLNIVPRPACFYRPWHRWFKRMACVLVGHIEHEQWAGGEKTAYFICDRCPWVGPKWKTESQQGYQKLIDPPERYFPPPLPWRWWFANVLQHAPLSWVGFWRIGLALTDGQEEHPEEYDHGCLCDLCKSYAD